jgi:hypothetical protein
MKSKKMLNDIKALLNIEVKLEDMKLENGTVITTEALEKGNEVFIVTDDEKVAMPVGEYILEDGKLLIVEEEGIIADVRDVSDDVPAKEEEDVTEDLEEEADVADWKGMEKRIQNLEDAIADLKGDKVEKSEDVEEEEMSTDSKMKSRTITEKFSEEVENIEVKEEVELSAKPIKHNPESGTTKKRVEFGKGRFNTTLDRVLNKLNK